MIRLAIDVVLVLAAFTGGWYSCRKWGSKADAVAKAVDQAVQQ